jgi:hypothetical protein
MIMRRSDDEGKCNARVIHKYRYEMVRALLWGVSQSSLFGDWFNDGIEKVMTLHTGHLVRSQSA